MSTNLPIIPGTLPSDCYSTWQSLFEDMARNSYAYFAEGSLKYIISETAPGSEDLDKLWIQTTANGNPVRQWIFNDGSWRWPHPIPSGDKRLIPFYGSSSEVNTLDGGTAGTVSDTSGPFWEIFEPIQNKFPIGAGDTYAVESTGGSTTSTLEESNLPIHNHDVYYVANANGGGSFHQGEGNFTNSDSSLGNDRVQNMAQSDTNRHLADPFNVLNPYYGVFFLKRTGRVYYTAS